MEKTYVLAIYSRETGERLGIEQANDAPMTFETREAANNWIEMFGQFIRQDYRVEEIEAL